MDREDLEEQIKDVLTLYDLLTRKISVNEAAILKSSITLMLYNIIESTITDCLTIIHIDMKVHSFDELNSSLQKLLSPYMIDKINKLEKKNFQNFKNDYESLDFEIPSYSELISYKKIISGNIDGKKINDIFKLYNIKYLECKEKNNLLKIKNLRNKLAHGNISFKHAGRNITKNELMELITSTSITLNEVVDNVMIYTDNKKFLKA